MQRSRSLIHDRLVNAALCRFLLPQISTGLFVPTASAEASGLTKSKNPPKLASLSIDRASQPTGKKRRLDRYHGG